MSKVIKTFQYGQNEVRLETGEVARQADGAVITSMGDTVVLVTVVGRKESSDRDFFPLTVEYEEPELCRRPNTRRVFQAGGGGRRKTPSSPVA